MNCSVFHSLTLDTNELDGQYKLILISNACSPFSQPDIFLIVFKYVTL